MQRRDFLHGLSAAGWLLAAGRPAAQTIKHYPFTLGVASGSPSVDGLADDVDDVAGCEFFLEYPAGEDEA